MSFEEIYKTYWQKIFRVCMGYVNDRDQAKDLAQDTFVVVFKKLTEFRNEANIGTWIFRIASNICLRQIERKNRHRKLELPTVLDSDPDNSLQPKIQFLYKCISELPEIERIIISLELEDLMQKEIAAIVGLSDSNVRVRIHRIKEKLRIKFNDYEG